jgi:hypothetical protein
MRKLNKRKVPMSFKTDPKFKQIIDVLAHTSGQKNSSTYMNQIVRAGINAGSEIAELKRKLAFYESSVQGLFEKYNGRTAQFEDGNDGSVTEIVVKKAEDIQLVLLKSYKFLCAIHSHRIQNERQ